MHDRVTEAAIVVVAEREKTSLIGIDHHLAIIGKVIRGEHIGAGAIRLTAEPDVAARAKHAPRARSVAAAEVIAVVVGFVDIGHAGDRTDPSKRLVEDKKPRPLREIAAARPNAPIRIQKANEIAVDGAKSIAGDVGAIRREAPGQRDRRTLGAHIGTVCRRAGPTIIGDVRVCGRGASANCMAPIQMKAAKSCRITLLP